MSVLPEHVFLHHVCAWSPKKLEEDVGSAGQSAFCSSFWKLLTSFFYIYVHILCLHFELLNF